MKSYTLSYIIFFFVILFGCIIGAVTNSKMHDFEGKCGMCHVNIPDNNKSIQDLTFNDEIDKLCEGCHSINKRKSHPINIAPKENIPLGAHLNKNGLLTCTTCHDVHKENKTSNRQELSGLLRGHVKGRAFCQLCHMQRTLTGDWRHQTAITYAHSFGKLTQDREGMLLDKYSIECLSCHDGTISKYPRVEVKQGIWQHTGGSLHPIGIDYPDSQDFVYSGSLPDGIRLFDRKIGCLSCHDMYSKENKKLAMNNKKSRLCLACHKK